MFGLAFFWSENNGLRDRWLDEMVNNGKPPQPPPRVPVFGRVGLNSDETAFLSLPPKFTNYPVLDPDNLKFESLLTDTNQGI